MANISVGDIYKYMGSDTHAPNNVKCVRFHPSITSVTHVFQDCTQLISVVLNEGLQKIGNCAFAGCFH